jgi:hypothetical protein
MADRSLSNHAVGVIAGPLMKGMIPIGRLPREQGEVKFLMMPKPLLGIASLFLAPGLYARHRGKIVSEKIIDQEARVLKATKETPGDGSTHWITQSWHI